MKNLMNMLLCACLSLTGCVPFLGEDDLANRLDVDGDGLSFVDGEDCNDRDGSVGGASVWYADADRDGVGGDETTTACTQPDGYVAVTGDCDDNDASLVEESTWYIDVDDDSFGGTQTTVSCGQPDGYVAENGDCDDTKGDIHPGAEEICDEIDNDCDDGIDEGVVPTWYRDLDEDGYGTDEDILEQCTQPSGYIAIDGDCLDSDSTVNPDGTEICDNGVDEDCNGITDDAEDAYIWYTDADEDGYGDPDTIWATCQDDVEGYVANGDDCDDTRPSVNPGAEEICNNDLDDDCDDETDTDTTFYDWYPDVDGDGYGDEDASATSDCENPGDYVTDNTDCDDTEAAANPGETEVCDDIDNNCDGDVNEGLTRTYYVDADGDGYGDSSSGTTEDCILPSGHAEDDGDCDDSDADVNPGETEVCRDGVDNDCDGTATGCEFTGTLSVSDADSTWTGEATGDYAGYELLGNCDLDHDGFPDVVFGASSNDEETTDGGAVYIDTSMTSGSSSAGSATTRIYGSASNGYFGYSLACGDFDGDGYDDLAVGAYGASSSAGRIHVFIGPISSGDMTDADADITRSGLSSGDETGVALASGDFDGDGYDDLAVGAPSENMCGADAGGVYIEYGPLTTGTEPIDEYAHFLCGYVGDKAGTGLLSIDTDLDGDDDLLIGAPGNNQGGTDAGLIYVLDSDPGTTTDNITSVADYELEGETAGDGAGSYFAKGDVDSDGNDDVMIGVNQYDGSGTDRGALYIFYTSLTRGDASLSTADIQLEGLVDYDNLGTDACVADVDGDGYGDLFVGAYADDTVASNAGTTYMWLGPITSGISPSSVDAELQGASSSDRAGERLEYAGDIDSDGYEDILVTARFTSSSTGSVYIYAGTGL